MNISAEIEKLKRMILCEKEILFFIGKCEDYDYIDERADQIVVVLDLKKHKCTKKNII